MKKIGFVVLLHKANNSCLSEVSFSLAYEESSGRSFSFFLLKE